MHVTSRRTSVAFFITLGACLVALTVALNVGWVLLNWREVALLVFGIVFFIAIIGGLILNTVFLVREIRLNEKHDSFIDAVTHELKTPIASIRLYLETLKTREVDEARRREFYDVMLADNDQLLNTVEQVLRAGRIHHRRGTLHKDLVDLGALVRECSELARARYHLDAAALQYSAKVVDGKPSTVVGDDEELRAVVTNLLDNAVKYSGPEVQVSVEVEDLNNKHVAVRVKDEGVGIARDQLNRIFKRFYRIQRRDLMRVKGTGLGLFIVRSIVKKHRGRVFAESAGEGHGSTFTIQLPRA